MGRLNRHNFQNDFNRPTGLVILRKPVRFHGLAPVATIKEYFRILSCACLRDLRVSVVSGRACHSYLSPRDCTRNVCSILFIHVRLVESRGCFPRLCPPPEIPPPCPPPKGRGSLEREGFSPERMGCRNRAFTGPARITDYRTLTTDHAKKTKNHSCHSSSFVLFAFSFFGFGHRFNMSLKS